MQQVDHNKNLNSLFHFPIKPNANVPLELCIILLGHWILYEVFICVFSWIGNAVKNLRSCWCTWSFSSTRANLWTKVMFNLHSWILVSIKVRRQNILYQIREESCGPFLLDYVVEILKLFSPFCLVNLSGTMFIPSCIFCFSSEHVIFHTVIMWYSWKNGGTISPSTLYLCSC